MKKSTLGVFVENIKYVVYQEGKFFVSLCLNAEVSSFGESVEEAITNLKEAVELYFDDAVINAQEL